MCNVQAGYLRGNESCAVSWQFKPVQALKYEARAVLELLDFDSTSGSGAAGMEGAEEEQAEDTNAYVMDKVGWVCEWGG